MPITITHEYEVQFRLLQMRERKLVWSDWKFFARCCKPENAEKLYQELCESIAKGVYSEVCEKADAQIITIELPEPVVLGDPEPAEEECIAPEGSADPDCSCRRCSKACDEQYESELRRFENRC